MHDGPTTIGLRVDVDTLRGTRYGVPNLVALFKEHGIQATFFFCVGPDNMGRHLWRLVNPAFFLKMLRTRAPSLYGWDILLKGSFFRPGPIIGEKAEEQIRTAAEAGHEIGLHAWDHHHWQRHIDKITTREIDAITTKAATMLSRISGKPVTCMAAPAWKTTPVVLADREQRNLRYASDCRGESIFYPVVNDVTLTVPQVPTTLPTFDELIGHSGITPANYNDHLFSLIKPHRLNVLTIHAEVEGLRFLDLFQQFISAAGKREIAFRSLGSLLPPASRIGHASIKNSSVRGRADWISSQADWAAKRVHDDHH